MKRCILLIGTIMAIPFLSGVASGSIWYVHPDSVLNSIQTGLNSCSTGDTVLVAPGIYTENIFWPPVNGISLFSESGPDTTVIDGNSLTTVVYFSGAVNIDTITIIRGFTIRYGFSDSVGGGIYMVNSSPRISDNIIRDNSATDDGGGICCDSSSPVIEDNIVKDNVASDEGGGIQCVHSSTPTITGNQITYNTAGFGGGIRCNDFSNPTITHNQITDNVVTWNGGGINCYYHCSPEITDNEITGNAANDWGGGIHCNEYSTPTITGNQITDNTADHGGGVLCRNYSSPTITGNQITYNEANAYGGGIYCDSSSPVITGNQITYNTADYGGGISCENHSNPSVSYNQITENDAGSLGDGIYCTNSSFPVVGDSNDIYSNGYGVYNADSSQYLLAEHNWWGHASGPYHPLSNPGGLGDTVSDYVDFDPWNYDPWWPVINETVSPTSLIRFILFQNCPNPFTDMTNLQWSIPKSCHTTLRIYNVSGQLVRTLVDEDQEYGNYSARWNGRDDGNQGVAQGVYFYRLEAGKFTSTKKMILLR